MFKKILVVVNTANEAKGIVTVALAYAKSCKSLLRLVDLSEVASYAQYTIKTRSDRLRSLQSTLSLKGLTAEIVRPTIGSGQAICNLAEEWEADLIVIGTEQAALISDVPCSVLQVQYDESTATTSVQMILKAKSDKLVRQRLEALYALKSDA